MRELPILDRVRANVQRLMTLPNRAKVKQVQIAKHVGMSSGQMTNFLKGRYGISFRQLDPLAEILGVPTSELVRKSSDPLYELSGDEARLVEYVRQWTPGARAALLDVLDFLHAKMPQDPQTVRMFDYWRRLDAGKRDLLYASAVRLNEETLAPDVRAALGIPATADDIGGRRGKRRWERP